MWVRGKGIHGCQPRTISHFEIFETRQFGHIADAFEPGTSFDYYIFKRCEVVPVSETGG